MCLCAFIRVQTLDTEKRNTTICTNFVFLSNLQNITPVNLKFIKICVELTIKTFDQLQF